MPEKYSKETEELFDEVRKLFNLKNTKFILDPNIDNSECTDHDKEFIPFKDGMIRCYLKSPTDSIHEGTHAYFTERERRLWRYSSQFENIETDADLEEVVARLIEVNSQNIILNVCTDNIQKDVKSTSESVRWHEDIEIGKKIIRLYMSIYKHNCVCPKDIELYNNIKNDIDPMVVYNKLAKYVGTYELIKDDDIRLQIG